MPAVKAFALFAAMAVFVDFLLQITCFVSILTLDTKRKEGRRLDLLCCVQTACKVDTVPVEQPRSTVFQQLVLPILFHRYTRACVFTVFLGMTCLSLSVLPHITVGLDQELAIPRHSHVHKYFTHLNKFLTIGPPVYFVLTGGLDVSDEAVQNVICGGYNCNPDSLSMQIYSATKQSHLTYIGRPASSWLEDYFDWIAGDGCCFVFDKNNSFCPHNYKDSNKYCSPCDKQVDLEKLRPDPASFKRYLPFFLQDNPDGDCSKGGHAGYSNAVNYKLDEDNNAIVGATHYMAFHTTLRTSSDYYGALREARVLADTITDMIRQRTNNTSVHVFPYSVFYVFFEQYLTIWRDTLFSIGVSLAAVFLVTFLLMRLDLVLSVIVVLGITMIIINIGGLMYVWNISLNAVSLVNLVMAIGISVEFCSHIVHGFSVSTKETRMLRAADALVTVGTSVFSGITLTKVFGIIVLGFANSQIFIVFYYRLYVGIVLFGALHGLIFLPVLLCSFGSRHSGRKEVVRYRKSAVIEEDGEGHVLDEVKHT